MDSQKEACAFIAIHRPDKPLHCWNAGGVIGPGLRSQNAFASERSSIGTSGPVQVEIWMAVQASRGTFLCICAILSMLPSSKLGVKVLEETLFLCTAGALFAGKSSVWRAFPFEC